MFGGRERGRVPIKTVHRITLSDPTNNLPPVHLPCQVIQASCDDHLWEGVALWCTAGVPPGTYTLQLDIQLQLSPSGKQVTITRRVAAQLLAKGTSLHVSKAVPALKEMWENAPEWLKLSAKGLWAFYGPQ